MKIKYYMRGLGIGILITTIVLSFGGKKEKLSDKDIMARARELGMEMKEDDNGDNLKEVLEHSLEKVDPLIDVAENKQDVDEDTGADISDSPDADISTDMDIQEPTDEDNVVDVVEPTDEDTEEYVQELSNENTDIEVTEPTEEDTGTNVDEPEPSQVTITIVRGMSSRQVSELLVEKGLIDDAVDFDNYIKRQGKAEVIRIGSYTLAKDSSYQAILNTIVR